MPEDTISNTDSSPELSDAARSFGRIAGLSSRENELLELAASGLADKEISARLGLAYTTIKSYWSRICFKIGVRNRQLAIGKLVADLARKACCCASVFVEEGNDRRVRHFEDEVRQIRLMARRTSNLAKGSNNEEDTHGDSWRDSLCDWDCARSHRFGSGGVLERRWLR